MRTRKGMPVNVFSFEKSAVDYLGKQNISPDEDICLQNNAVLKAGQKGNYIHPVVAIS